MVIHFNTACHMFCVISLCNSCQLTHNLVCTDEIDTKMINLKMKYGSK